MPSFLQAILLSRTPIVAAVSVALALLLLGGLKFGLEPSMGLALAAAAAVGVLAILVAALNKRRTEVEQQNRVLRFSVERLQAMLSTVPVGYCLFTPQGILRETQRAAQILGIEKVSHVEDIVSAIKDGAAFVDAFRKLQSIGLPFTLQVETVLNGKLAQIIGDRFRVGREGPQIDVLWLTERVMPSLQALGFGSAASLSTTMAVSVESRPTESVAGEAAAIVDAVRHDRDSQTLLDALPFPVWGRKQDLSIAFCNRAYANALDMKPEDVLRGAQGQGELVSSTTRGGTGRTLAADAQATGALRKERRHVIITGQRRLLEIVEIPLKTLIEAPVSSESASDGNAPGGGGVAAEGNETMLALLGFAVDVTVEEERELELQHHLAAQKEVLEQLGSAIAIYGRDMRLEFYNRAYQRLWDADETFLASKPTLGEILEDLRTRRRAPEQADFQRYKNERIALFTSLLEPREDLMHLPDGTTLRILAVPHPFGGIMFVHEDVTDKLALESSYNTLIAVQRETLDNLAEGIAVFGPDGKLRLFNPSFANIWKLEADFLSGNPHIADLLEKMKPLLAYDGDWAVYKAERVGYALDRNPRKGRLDRADSVIVEYSTIPLPDGAVLNSYLDVTDSVQVQKALRETNEALTAADRLKSEFVANVSYQLRTPLNTIMGFAEILTNQYFGTLNTRQLDYTRTIMDASKKLLVLINDVLDLATIEAGRMALERDAIRCAELLNVAKNMTAEWARQQSLEIMIDCPSDIGSFEADEQRMKQILFNLISNAIKYTPAGGRITLEARRSEPWMILTVADTGIGIPEPDRDRVFGKFERTNAQARQAGAGLGLSLVKSFIELHGGHVELESGAEQGTRIVCYVPTKMKAERDEDSRGAGADTPDKMRA
ncbi:MAG: ATP-binding protein [Bdellovibrionales bacterium]